MNRKWTLLQQLKARNRSRRMSAAATAQVRDTAHQQGTAAADDGSAAHLSLLGQLQGLMQGPVGSAVVVAEQAVVPVHQQQQQQASSGARPDLDAAAALALQGVLEQALLIKRQQPPQVAALGMQQQEQQQQQQLAGLANIPGGPAITTAYSTLNAAMVPASSNSSCAIQTEPSLLGVQQQQQPLLLPRMLSRAPLLDAEVQAGSLGLAQRQQLMAAAATQTAAAAAPPDPVEVVLNVSSGQPASTQAVLPPAVQQQHSALYPATLMALAAAAGAGAASAVTTAAFSPTKQPARGLQNQPAAPNAAPPPQQRGVDELARLILGAFEQQGGVIQPDAAALATGVCANSSSAAGSSSVSAQHQLLPNPLAGPAAPQFLQVVDIQDAPPSQPWQQQQQPSHQQLWQQQQQWHSQQQLLPTRVMESTLDGYLNLGCCFAGCPERVASPSFKGSPPAAAISSMRASSAQRSQQQQQQQQYNTGGSRDTSRPRDVISKHNSSTGKTTTGSMGKQPKRGGSAGISRHNGASVNGSRSQHMQQSGMVRNLSDVGGMLASNSLPAAGRSSPLRECREAQTQQLDQIWQQWQQQQQQAQMQQRQHQQVTSAASPGVPSQQQQQSKENSNPNIQQAAILAAAAGGEGQQGPDDELNDGQSAAAESSLSRAAARAAAKKLAEAEQQLSQQQLVQQVRIVEMQG
jgi:hypothetical protein